MHDRGGDNDRVDPVRARLSAGGEGEVEGDGCAAAIGMGGDGVGELSGDPEPVAAVMLGGRAVVAGGGRDRGQPAVVDVHPG